MRRKVQRYVRAWERRGYPAGIPDEVPERLMQLGLAPSYKAVCIAILKNDHSMQSLGFTPRPSPWYTALKRIELSARGVVLEEPVDDRQLVLPWQR